MAKRDAHFAIQLWPCWWRGYFRLGKVEDALGNYRNAKDALNKALALNFGSEEIRRELHVINSKVELLKYTKYKT